MIRINIKMLCVMLTLFLSVNVLFAQIPTEQSVKLTSDELKEYIDSAKAEGNKFINRFLVYAVYVSSDDSQINKINYTLGHLLNSHSFKNILTNYYMEFEGEYVLVRYQDEGLKEVMSNFNVKELDDEMEIKLAQKLYPESVGSFTGSSLGCVLKKSTDEIIAKYYGNSGDIPRDLSIYNFDRSDDLEFRYMGNIKDK